MKYAWPLIFAAMVRTLGSKTNWTKALKLDQNISWVLLREAMIFQAMSKDSMQSGSEVVRSWWGKIKGKKHMIITMSETDVCSYGYSSIYISLYLTLGTKILIHWNTGKTCSEGRTVRASSADCKVLTATGTAGRVGSRISPSEAGMRVWHFLNKKERQTHWSWIYCATIFPHPWEDDDSSKKLRQKSQVTNLILS